MVSDSLVFHTRKGIRHLHVVVAVVDKVLQVNEETDARFFCARVKGVVPVDAGAKHGDDGLNVPLSQSAVELDVAHDFPALVQEAAESRALVCIVPVLCKIGPLLSGSGGDTYVAYGRKGSWTPLTISSKVYGTFLSCTSCGLCSSICFKALMSSSSKELGPGIWLCRSMVKVVYFATCIESESLDLQNLYGVASKS
jgi:ferredoxin